MLKDFFLPISKSFQENIPTFSRYQIGKSIDYYSENFPEMEQVKIAIIGLDNSFDDVRPFFYALNQHLKGLKIADLGNVKSPTSENISLILKELLSKGILPIVIGESIQNAYELYDAYSIHNRLTNMVIVDEKIPYSMDKQQKQSFYLNKILDKPTHNLFNLGIIGYQSHYVDKRILAYFDKEFFEYQRLGRIRKNLEETEPLIRDADLMCFDLSVLKRIEVPGCLEASPSGIFTEDACQIAYYAGMSDKMSSFGIFGFNAASDNNTQTAQTVSQLIWYFLYGYYNRKQDYPVSMGNFMEYIVDFKNSNYQITFWKSSKSDRWWMEVPTKDKRQKRHRLIPCSYQDYLQACREELPERLLNAYKRFGG
jgi:formiminoglutamase